MEQPTMFLILKSRLFREGLNRIFAGSDFKIAFESESVDGAIKKLEELTPSLLLIDPYDNPVSTDDWVAAVRAVAPATRIVILAPSVQMKQLARALSAGVDGYLLKDVSGEALQQSLKLVLLGEKVFPTDLAHLLADGFQNLDGGEAVIPGTNGLSERETQILQCLLQGDSNKMIANRLDITEATVKVHVKAVLKKINVRNRTQAAIWALSSGLGRMVGDRAA